MQTTKIHESTESFLEMLSKLPPDQQLEIFNRLPPYAQQQIIDGKGWWTTARIEQLPPDGAWFVWMLRSGRGAGKTRTGSEFVIQRAKLGYKHIALVGETKADVRDIMVELGNSSILKVSEKDFYPDYEPSKRRLTFPNGCVCTIYSGDEPDQLRGPEHDTAWVDELAKFRYPQETWDNLEMGLRQAEDPRVVVTTTPRPIPVIKESCRAIRAFLRNM